LSNFNQTSICSTDFGTTPKYKIWQQKKTALGDGSPPRGQINGHASRQTCKYDDENCCFWQLRERT